MPVTQLFDVVIPEEFTAYQVENSLVSTALSQSGVVAKNAVIAAQLGAGAESFTVPFWNDLPALKQTSPMKIRLKPSVRSSKLTALQFAAEVTYIPTLQRHRAPDFTAWTCSRYLARRPSPR